MRLITILLVAIMQLAGMSAFAVTPVKTKDALDGKKVTLYPLDNGYYKIENLTIGQQQIEIADGKLYYAEYGDGSGVFIGLEITLKNGKRDSVTFAIADFWKTKKDEDEKGRVDFVCSDGSTYADVYAINKYCQGLIIVSDKPTILVKYSPESLVKINPVSALEKILDLDN